MRRIQTVRVDVDRLDKLMNLVEELAISKLRLIEVGVKSQNTDLKGIIEGLSRLTDDLQTEVMQARLVPVAQVFDRFPRLVRDLAKAEGKEVRFDVSGQDIELDRTLLDEIGDPLIHILRNAIDHGIETPEERRKGGKLGEGHIALSARREKSHVFIEIEDDGRGMDAQAIKKAALESKIASEEKLNSMTEEEVLMLTTHPGLSTKQEVTDVSGRGVGLDVAREVTESLGGDLLIESRPNAGCKITMRLPVTTAVVRALLVKSEGRVYAIPIASVVEIIVAGEGDIKRIEQNETLLHRDYVLPIVRLGNLFESSGSGARSAENASPRLPAPSPEPPPPNTRLKIVVVEFGARKFGIVVDGLMSQQDIVIKQLTKELKGIRGFAGATILGDGSVALVLDVATLI
jgi:two-component system chemotaxis sensor kinase CheA